MLKTMILWLALACPLAAAPMQYALQTATSDVGFEVSMGQTPLRGTMPVASADIRLDFDNAAASQVSVTLSPGKARMGLPFAAEAMKGPDVLATKAYPEIIFESTQIRAEGDGAIVEGKITIRGVTRPITLAARLSRPQGTPEGYRDDLTIRLTGAVSRAAFGATGYPDMVGDEVRLDIRAHVRRVPAN